MTEPEELSVKCADCDKPLLEMLFVRDSEKRRKLIINWPFCKGQSWTHELNGDYFQAPPEGLKLGEMEEKDGLYELNMEKHDA